MTPSIRSELLKLGADLSPTMIQETQRLIARHLPGLRPDVVVTRDHSYGPDPRHRLDVFAPRVSLAPAPVLVFVHGGGFVMGDKRVPDLPYYDNVGDFAVRSGCVGVTITYRLAPAHPWPAGSEDVAAAVRWVRAHIADHGGDPGRIFLMGQSAGAVHVAGYVGDTALHPPEGVGLAAALLLSGMYDVSQAPGSPFHAAYYGEDQSQWAARAPLQGLTQAQLPLFFTVSELDPVDFQKQAVLAVSRMAAVRQSYPQMHWLYGHNHISPVLALGSPLDTLGPLIRQLIASLAE